MLYYVEFHNQDGPFAGTFVEQYLIRNTMEDNISSVRRIAMERVSPNTTGLTVYIHMIDSLDGSIVKGWITFWQGSWAFGPGKWLFTELESDEMELMLV